MAKFEITDFVDSLAECNFYRMVSDNVNALAVTTVSSGGNGSSGCTISGLFTTRDFMHKMALKDRDARTVTVGEVCSWRLISVTKSTPIEKCMEIMLEHGVRHLFIKDDVSFDCAFVFAVLALSCEYYVRKVKFYPAKKKAHTPRVTSHLGELGNNWIGFNKRHRQVFDFQREGHSGSSGDKTVLERVGLVGILTCQYTRC